MSDFHHAPVLLEECIAGLRIRPEGTYVDGTLGGKVILNRCSHRTWGWLKCQYKPGSWVTAAETFQRYLGTKLFCFVFPVCLSSPLPVRT